MEEFKKLKKMLASGKIANVLAIFCQSLRFSKSGQMQTAAQTLARCRMWALHRMAFSV